MKDELKVFEYEGKSITFNLGNGDVMVNATEMAKHFGKNVKDWTRLQSTDDYINALKSAKGQISLLDVIKGGNNPGTWMHEDVAIEFARWLSPMFAIWCNDRIKELMKTGTTSIYSLPKTFSEALQLAADQAKELESKKEEIALLDKLVDTLEPKAKVYNQISESETLLSLNDAAKVIGMGRNIMMEDLRRSGVFRANNTPYQKHIDSGLFEVKVKSVSMGFTTGNYPQTFVTGKGLTWLSKRYPKNEEKEATPKVKMI